MNDCVLISFLSISVPWHLVLFHQNGDRDDSPESSFKTKTSPRRSRATGSVWTRWRITRLDESLTNMWQIQMSLVLVTDSRLFLFSSIFFFLRRWQMAQWWLWFRSKCLRITSQTHSHLRARSVDTVHALSLFLSSTSSVTHILVFLSFYPSYAVLPKKLPLFTDPAPLLLI